MRSATARMALRTCSIQTIVTPRSRIVRRDRRATAILPPSSPPAISSSSRSFGFASQRARELKPLAVEQSQFAGRAGSPCREARNLAELRCNARSCARSSARRRTWRRRADSRKRSSRHRARELVGPPDSHLATAVRRLASQSIAGERQARPHRATASPLIRLNSVVFPAPLGPRTPRTSPAKTSKSTS